MKKQLSLAMAGVMALTGIQWGKLPDTKGWTVPVDAQ